MIRKAAGLLVFAVSLGAIAALGQQDFTKVEVKTTPVAGNIHMLEGRGGNIGVSVGEDGILMIDDQYAPLAEKIRAALAKLGSDKPRFVLNTHWHADHTGGNVEFGKDGTIIAHSNVRKRLSEKQQVMGRPSDPQPAQALPVITFDESLSLHFNGEEIRVMHLPRGHTDGDSVVFFTKSNVVHMGDLLFNGMFPFIDLESGGDVAGYVKNVETVLKELKPDTQIIAGHGPLASVEDVKTVLRMLHETVGVVKSALAAKKSVEEIKAAGLPKEWESWGQGFIKTDKWIEIVHESLTR
jgi:glyoxylase-like metal-dependent hydrolase (beta-lactamase superfamily II)